MILDMTERKIGTDVTAISIRKAEAALNGSNWTLAGIEGANAASVRARAVVNEAVLRLQAKVDIDWRI
jgi:hypothetical protein